MKNSEFKISNSKTHRFTLVELLVVIGVMGLLMSISMPQFTKLIKGNKVNSVASKVGSTLTYCRTFAISKRCKTRFTFTSAGSNTSAGAYTTEYMKSDGTWADITNQTATPLEKALESTVTITVKVANSLVPSNTPIIFRATGATENASVEITAAGAEGSEKKVTLNQFTGKVSYP